MINCQHKFGPMPETTGVLCAWKVNRISAFEPKLIYNVKTIADSLELLSAVIPGFCNCLLVSRHCRGAMACHFCFFVQKLCVWIYVASGIKQGQVKFKSMSSGWKRKKTFKILSELSGEERKQSGERDFSWFYTSEIKLCHADPISRYFSSQWKP